MPFLLIAFFVILISTAAALIQRVSGFGFGIFAMMFFPHIIGNYAQANALSGILSLVSCTAVVLTMLKNVDWKNLIFPMIGNICVVIPVVVYILRGSDSYLLLMLGIALVLMSVYFFFFSSRVHFRATWYGGLTAGGLSGFLGGLFGMGGPPVVVYFMQSENGDPAKYLATIQMYFLMSNLVGTTTKALNGFVTMRVLMFALLGIVGLFIGNIIGKRIFNRLNIKILRKIVYGFMAISGVINIVTALMP